MAAHTLTNTNLFPNGTSVGAYSKDAFPSNQPTPLGSALDTQTMTNGTLTFTGLVEDTNYIAAASVNGTWRTLSFRVDVDPHNPVYTDEATTFTGNVTFNGDVELPAGVVDEADLSFSIATQAELDAHEADTTSIHGIANTANLPDQTATETVSGAWTFSTAPTILSGTFVFAPDPTGVAATDTTALQGKIDGLSALGGGTLWLQEGTYLISTTLTVPSNVTIRGLGPASILKTANAANVDTVTVAASASNVTLADLKLDGNRANQTGAVYCVRTDSPTNLAIDGCEIASARAAGLFLTANTTVTATRIENSRIRDCGTYAADIRAANGLSITNCDIESWGQVTAASPAIKLVMGGSGGVTANVDVTITGNRFKNTVGTQFAIESSAGANAVVTDGATISGNVFDGGGLGGNGVSGYFINSSMVGNSHPNGSGTHRSGYEIDGQNVTIAGNTIEDGIIALTSVASGTEKNFTIVGNDITNTKANGSGGIGIQFGTSNAAITDILISGNRINLTNAGPQSAIYAGLYGTAGVVNRVTIVGNQLYGPGSAGNGVRLAGAAGCTDILIASNAAKGFGTGFLSPANTNHDEVTVNGNDFRGNTTPISHSATGGTYRFFGNVSTDDSDAFRLSGEIEIDGPLNHDGTTVGFYGVAPVTRAAAITAPSGGATIDAEARTAINSIRTALTNIGVTS